MSEEKILLGMSRTTEPPDNRYVDSEGKVQYADIVVCGCGHHLWTRESTYEHWKQGHFDTPVYATKEEMLNKMAERKLAAEGVNLKADSGGVKP